MNKFRSAFSLVEMLVVILILSLLIGTAIYALKFQMMSFEKQKEKSFNRVLSTNQLRTSIESIKYYVVDQYDMFGNPMQDFKLYFKGTEDSIDYITENPFLHDAVSVVSLRCKENQLIYTEEPLYKRINYLQPKVLDRSPQITLFDNLDVCQFRYINQNKQLFDSFIHAIPQKIHISLEERQEPFDLYIQVHSDYNRSLGEVYDAYNPLQ